MKHNYLTLLCISSRREASNVRHWTNFFVSDFDKEYMKIIPKYSLPPEGEEVLLTDNLVEKDPQFKELLHFHVILNELRNYRFPLTIECFFNNQGKCCHLDYVSTSSIQYHPQIDAKLRELAKAVSRINIQNYIHADDKVKHYYKYNFSID